MSQNPNSQQTHLKVGWDVSKYEAGTMMFSCTETGSAHFVNIFIDHLKGTCFLCCTGKNWDFYY